METQSAKWSKGSPWLIILLPLKNFMYHTASFFVLQVPEICTYLHDRIAKKKAPMNSSHSFLS
jgi:hypothetical protein